MGCIKPHDHNIFTCPVMKKGRPRITSAERVRYIEKTRKKVFLEQNLVFQSPLGLNTSAETRENLFPKSDLVFPSTFSLITSTKTREKRISGT